MGSMANISQSLSKNSNKMTKGPLSEWRFSQEWWIWQKGKYGENLSKFKWYSKGAPSKVAIFTIMANLMKMPNMTKLRRSLSNKWNEMAKGPFQSGDVDENGQFDEHGKHGENSQSIVRHSHL